MKPEIEVFIKSQASLRLYKNVQDALGEVLASMPDGDYQKVTQNLIIMAMHEGATGQVMHFPPNQSDFTVMQLSIPKEIPFSALKSVIAHELGHVMQGRNWQESDGDDLEKDADNWAEKWGFPATLKDLKWLEAARTVPQKGDRF